jgi:protein TonB
MLLAAGHSWRPEHGLGRWTGAVIVTVALHTGAVAAGLMTWQSITPPAPPPAAIMMELAPLPVAPPAPLTQAAQEPAPPEAPLAPTVEPEPLPEPPMLIPPVDPVPPAMREPEVVLPKPLPKQPQVEEVAEAPKEKPKKEKLKEKPKPGKPKDTPTEKVKPKPEAKPDPKAEPAVTQQSMPQPAQQAAPAAAPVQQAAVAAAPSVAEIARRANAEANWQGLLLAHLEKHKKYPKSARKRHEQGTSFLRFRMDRNGAVLSFALARSSGHAALDEEVLAMIARAQPLPALPAEMADSVIEIVVPVQFTLR